MSILSSLTNKKNSLFIQNLFFFYIFNPDTLSVQNTISTFLSSTYKTMTKQNISQRMMLVPVSFKITFVCFLDIFTLHSHSQIFPLINISMSICTYETLKIVILKRTFYTKRISKANFSLSVLSKKDSNMRMHAYMC